MADGPPHKKARLNEGSNLCDVCDEFLQLERNLCEDLDCLSFSCKSLSCVYNPLVYARATHEDYIRKYCRGGGRVMFLGMNPGPFGMAQNGVSMIT